MMQRHKLVSFKTKQIKDALLFTLLLFCTYCFFISSLLLSPTVSASNVTINQFSDGTLGKYIQYFQEQNTQLSLSQAQEHFAHSPTTQSQGDSISLGIGVAPVWMKFTVLNNTDLMQNYRLAIETPWLDNIDTWLVEQGNIIKHIPGGDAYAYEDRPMQYKFYAFEHSFSNGTTEVYIRVESKGPMAIPIRFSSKENAINRDISSAYQYGILYGIMSALALYNLVLFVFIRQKEYGLYSLYLIGFVLNSLSYTGQLHTVITQDFGPYFQDWLDISLMITYSVAGLHFARTLLNTKAYAPKLDNFVVRTTIIIPLGMLIGFVLDRLFFSMSLAFILNTTFVVLFMAMGVYALLARRPFSLIFLISSVTAAICITISTLAVAGVLVPYNDYTFKAIEVGMAFEAILLAVILARQFRMAKMDKLLAESYARTDPLTQLNNRRGFQEVSLPIWQNIVRVKREAAIVLLDIDLFKQFNDQYGHETGDKVLKLVANCISDTSRKSDVAARWGGEEFVIFLPETTHEQACLQAERIRHAIEQLDVQVAEQSLSVTASFGVAGSQNHQFNQAPITLKSFEALINQADKALYVAKQNGKNQIYAGQ